MTEKKTTGMRKKTGSSAAAPTSLSAARRELKKETARRQAVEQELRKSREHAAQLAGQSQLLQKKLQLLSRRILLIQEEERKRISRELHDVIAQTLAGINIQLAALKIETDADSKELRRKISSTQELVEKSVDIVHRFARELRPPMLDDLGLIPALHTFMKNYTEETGIRVHFTAFSGVEKISELKRLTLCRIA
jgi:signal transduction histidine kinase